MQSAYSLLECRAVQSAPRLRTMSLSHRHGDIAADCTGQCLRVWCPIWLKYTLCAVNGFAEVRRSAAGVVHLAHFPQPTPTHSSQASISGDRPHQTVHTLTAQRHTQVPLRAYWELPLLRVRRQHHSTPSQEQIDDHHTLDHRGFDETVLCHVHQRQLRTHPPTRSHSTRTECGRFVGPHEEAGH